MGAKLDTYSIAQVLNGIGYETVAGTAASANFAEITGLTSDSRLCKPGSVFVAIPGTRVDGHEYVQQAIDSGATLIVVQRNHWQKGGVEGVSVIEVEDSRSAYAVMAANIYGNPARELRLVGITGTNGKTTITYLLEEILIGIGHTVGVIGTVDYRWFGTDGQYHHRDAARTTPDALELHAILRDMVDDGVEYVLMEVSSHALDQRRIGGLEFCVGAFTNLSHDHLDYHHDLTEYFNAKTLLFTSYLKQDGVAVVNVSAENASWGEQLKNLCSSSGITAISAGESSDDDVRLIEQQFDINHSTLKVKVGKETVSFHSPLVGRFNVENLLTTLSITIALDMALEEVVPRLALAAGAPGRLQRVELAAQWRLNTPEIFVDYAHTPDALEKVLQTLNELPHNNLICVFGCGGDRDKRKRPVMGRIAAELSTISVITSDNPRTENPEKILDHIVEGVSRTGHEIQPVDWLQQREDGERGCVIIEDRAEAIRTAVSYGGEGDIVLIAGKGHEKYQLIRGTTRFFDDCLEAKKAMLAWNGDILEKALSSSIEGKLRHWWSGRIETDSRKVGKGDIFVALKGPTFDGHDYVGKAEEKGAAVAVISDQTKLSETVGIPYVVVDDTLKGLGRLAAFRRKLIQGVKQTKIVGITGSCGKTTVKEMAASILEQQWPAGKGVPSQRIVKTRGNFNNLVGVPLSIFPMSLDHEAAVFEMGMNRAGEIEALTRMIAPDISCITNIHAVHLEQLVDIDGVAKAKKELFDHTAPDKTLICNLDDEQIRPWVEEYPHRKITFSLDEKKAADLHAMDIACGADGCCRFVLDVGGSKTPVQLEISGEHNVANGLTAAAICHAMGVGMAEIAKGLESFTPVEKRGMVISLKNGLNLINDSYNANPVSVAAGVKTLMSMQSGKKLAVLGDMLELGSVSEQAHFTTGEMLGRSGVDYVALFGQESRQTLKGAVQAGMDEGAVKWFEDKQQLARWIQTLKNENRLADGDWLLLKGSRGMRMETVLAELEGEK